MIPILFPLLRLHAVVAQNLCLSPDLVNILLKSTGLNKISFHNHQLCPLIDHYQTNHCCVYHSDLNAKMNNSLIFSGRRCKDCEIITHPITCWSKMFSFLKSRFKYCHWIYPTFCLFFPCLSWVCFSILFFQVAYWVHFNFGFASAITILQLSSD